MLWDRRRDNEGEEGLEKKIKIIAHSWQTDGGTDSEGMIGWSRQIRYLMKGEVEADHLGCHQLKKKKNTCRNEYWVETLHLFSLCPSVVHQVHHSGPVTCRQKRVAFVLPFFWFWLARLCVCNFSKLFLQWMDDVLLCWFTGGDWIPPPHDLSTAFIFLSCPRFLQLGLTFLARVFDGF